MEAVAEPGSGSALQRIVGGSTSLNFFYLQAKFCVGVHAEGRDGRRTREQRARLLRQSSRREGRRHNESFHNFIFNFLCNVKTSIRFRSCNILLKICVVRSGRPPPPSIWFLSFSDRMFERVWLQWWGSLTPFKDVLRWLRPPLHHVHRASG